MTGHEFKRLVELYGSQASTARALGVDADTIRARYRDEHVPLLYEHAIVGLVLKTKLPEIVEIAEIIGINCAKQPK